jgi:hypothetical protein
MMNTITILAMLTILSGVATLSISELTVINTVVAQMTDDNATMSGNTAASFENLQNSTTTLEATLEVAGEDADGEVRAALGEHLTSLGGVGTGIINATGDQLSTVEEATSLANVAVTQMIEAEPEEEIEEEAEEQTE